MNFKTSILNLEQVFKLDKRIRYAQIVSSDGKVLAGGMRKGLEESNLDPPELRMERIQQFLASREMSEMWATRYGKYVYSVIVFDNIKLFVFPLDMKNTLYVSVASSISRSSVARILRDFLGSSLV